MTSAADIAHAPVREEGGLYMKGSYIYHKPAWGLTRADEGGIGG